jgi:O-methyltransferase
MGLVRFIAEYIHPQNFLEFGSGEGNLANAIADHVQLTDSYCIEPLIECRMEKEKGLNLLNIDVFSQEIPNILNKKFDLVLSIEVAEHIERSRHEELFDFLVSRTGKYVVFSGAHIGQGGHGHVAERCEDEWRNEFVQRGLQYEPKLTIKARNLCNSKNINHRRNIQVFSKPLIYAGLEELETRAKGHLRDILNIILSTSSSLVGNLFYADLKGALGGMPEYSLKNKRYNLLNKAKKASNILEIGFNAGHSALLFLLASPHSKLTIVDTFQLPYTQKCFDYLRSMFPGRLEMIAGDSRDVLPTLSGGHFDLIHYDGGKEKTLEADLNNSRNLVDHDHVLVIDDIQNQKVNEILQQFEGSKFLNSKAFNKENIFSSKRKWKHQLGRFTPCKSRVDTILEKTVAIYKDTDFQSIYTNVHKDGRLAGWPRAANLFDCIKRVENAGLGGAFLEVGVAAGHSSVIAALSCTKYIEREFYLYDTYEGFAKISNEHDFHGKSIQDYDLSRYKSRDCQTNIVRERMLKAGVSSERLFLIQGLIQDTKDLIRPDSIAVLRIDCDLYEPTLISLQTFYDLLDIGGFLILDDYGYWQGAKQSVDEFFNSRVEKHELKAVDQSCYVMEKKK